MNPNDDVVRELIAIKRLLAYKFLDEGMSQESIAEALGVNQSSVSRMFARRAPVKQPKRGNRA